jgi:GT2 family glycosyltransferase
MAVSVIISNFNGARFLPKLLETLKAQEEVRFEIIVVDRESTDESPGILRLHPEVKVVSEPPLAGLVSGYARGAREARHEHLFFCNEDMWFDSRCLSLLEKRMDLSARIGVTDPWQWTYDGGVWIHGSTRFRKKTWAINSAYPFRDCNTTIEASDGEVIPYACAGAMMIHRQVYDEIGGWDTSFFLDYEDVDFCIRTWQRGWKSVSVPSAKVFHAVGMSNIHTTGTKVKASKRRYVSGLLSRYVIVWKYFSFSSLWMAFGIFSVVFANNLVKGRFKTVTWDLIAVGSFIARFGPTHDFRRSNKEYNRSKPGERFFTSPEFQI